MEDELKEALAKKKEYLKQEVFHVIKRKLELHEINETAMNDNLNKKIKEDDDRILEQNNVICMHAKFLRSVFYLILLEVLTINRF
jgi:hypothetical protein